MQLDVGRLFECGFTRGEIEVAMLLVEGKNTDEIALALNLKKKAIRNRLTALFKRLNISGKNGEHIAGKAIIKLAEISLDKKFDFKIEEVNQARLKRNYQAGKTARCPHCGRRRRRKNGQHN